MASTSETGHAKNVANFQTLINSCAGLGDLYQPYNVDLQLAALTPKLSVCKAANTAVKDPLVAYNAAVSQRAELFKPLSKLVTRLLAIFKTTAALKQQKDYAKTIADKIRGNHNKQPAAEGQDSYSTSQQSFVMRTDNFETFIGILNAEGTYKPLEHELQVATLQEMLTSMNALNNAVDIAYHTLQLARNARNTALYAQQTGMVDTALAVKEYLKGAFGSGSTQFRSVSGLKFIRFM